jgi:hypothetical protein
MSSTTEFNLNLMIQSEEQAHAHNDKVASCKTLVEQKANKRKLPSFGA